jgi:hypothetical protein
MPKQVSMILDVVEHPQGPSRSDRLGHAPVGHIGLAHPVHTAMRLRRSSTVRRSSSAIHSAAESLAVLGLRHAAAHLDDLVATSTKKHIGPPETIELLVEREGQHRAQPHRPRCSVPRRRVQPAQISQFLESTNIAGGVAHSPACAARRSEVEDAHPTGRHDPSHTLGLLLGRLSSGHCSYVRTQSEPLSLHRVNLLKNLHQLAGTLMFLLLGIEFDGRIQMICILHSRHR